MEVHVRDEIRCFDLNRALYDHNFEIKQVNGQYILDYRTDTCQICASKPTVIVNGKYYCAQHASTVLQKKIG